MMQNPCCKADELEVRLPMTTPEVDGYQVISHLGEGGASHVWLAEHLASRVHVVLKVLKTTPAEDLDAFQRFRQEHAFITASRHAGVVTVFEDGFAAGYPYLSMEYFPRGSLKDALDAALSPRQSLAVLAQLAGALAEIHGHGIVHRDLKPANILVRDDGTMAIADFGVAARSEAVAADAQSGKVFGSPHYLAPELIRGEPASPLTDLYSLGVMFHEMLTGKKPFTGANVRELAQQHLHAPPPRLEPSLKDYQPLHDGLLAKNPAERFQSAQELLVGVDEVWTMLAVRVSQLR